MMKFEGTDIGETVRVLRRSKGMSRPVLSKAAGISESHLKKIETGVRQPGIDTYRKLLETLEAEIVIMDKEKISIEEIDEILNKKSGVFGVSGISPDSRDIEAAAAEGNERAKQREQQKKRTGARRGTVFLLCHNRTSAAVRVQPVDPLDAGENLFF